MTATDNAIDTEAFDEERPPLPPRPSVAAQGANAGESSAAAQLSHANSTAQRPHLQSKPTTAVSSVDIQTLTFPDGSRGTFQTSNDDASAPGPSQSLTEHGLTAGKGLSKNSDIDDATSVMSFAPTNRAPGDLESLLAGSLGSKSPAWKLLSSHNEPGDLFESVELNNDDALSQFEHEFDEIAEVNEGDGNEELLLSQWKSKLKHYMILSSAGKPIWSRHGDQSLINGYIGIIQTIISFYEESKDPLQSFTAGRTRFVVTTNGPLYFVAISRLRESESQLRAQLDALYMQILSTLTLPTLTHLFTNRPSTDLRKPLQGTEPLLCSLADNFTRGSPSSLLSALECLKVRKSQRHVINNTLLKARSDKLLYGLIVAGGRLVSVIRPKRHSLHPSDLLLIFNMLFEAGGVKAGGGENWIPLCLPGFNNRGYLYMYVSFLGAFNESEDEEEAKDLVNEQPNNGEHPNETSERTSTKSKQATNSAHSGSQASREDDVAVLLISADKESFFELKQMRDDVVEQLHKNGSMDIIKAAVRRGRPSTHDIVPASPVRHFLYRSRANVQFTMSSFSPDFDGVVERRRLLSLYHDLHTAVHAKTSHLKVLHGTSRDAQALGWITPAFEFFCVAGPRAPRAALTQSANKIVQWVKREEERLFIIGGAVF